MGWRLILICYHIRHIGVVCRLEAICRRCESGCQGVKYEMPVDNRMLPVVQYGHELSGEECSRELEVR